MSLITYTAMDFWRNLRNMGNSFFVIMLPTALYIFFGVNTGWADESVGDGNVSAWTMIAMASYGAAMATTSLAGAAAVELQQGWGRQLAMTSLPHGMYVVSKTVTALIMASCAVVVLNVVGLFTTAEMTPVVWVQSAVLTVVGALPFALYGLAAGLAFRSDAAVGAASGFLVIMGFLGNAFAPLDGALLDFARFTPMYGTVALARYPLSDGVGVTMSGEQYTDPLWGILLNVGVWALIFGLLCLMLGRRATMRR